MIPRRSSSVVQQNTNYKRLTEKWRGELVCEIAILIHLVSGSKLALQVDILK